MRRVPLRLSHPAYKPTVVSPLGVVTKSHSTILRLAVDMRYVNDHLTKRVFKFEGLSDLSDMSEKGDYSLSYDSGYNIGVLSCST